VSHFRRLYLLSACSPPAVCVQTRVFHFRHLCLLSVFSYSTVCVQAQVSYLRRLCLLSVFSSPTVCVQAQVSYLRRLCILYSAVLLFVLRLRCLICDAFVYCVQLFYCLCSGLCVLFATSLSTVCVQLFYCFCSGSGIISRRLCCLSAALLPFVFRLVLYCPCTWGIPLFCGRQVLCFLITGDHQWTYSLCRSTRRKFLQMLLWFLTETLKWKQTNFWATERNISSSF
jgi:hypothetical protein